jgi:hypothetical protein
MTDTMFVAVMSLVGTLIGALGGILASSKLTNWRLQKLEEKVDKHNSLMERTCILERDMARMQKDHENTRGD